MQKKKGVGDETLMTRTEVKKLEKALKDPQFQKYWNEYMDEITDPAGRKEREEFMIEQEQKHDLPPNTKLIRPDASFCIKTFARRLLTTQTEKKYLDQKLFINICTSYFVQPPVSEEQVVNGVKTTQWSLPYALSKPRADKDSKKEICMVIDVIFNSKCLNFIRFDEFRKMLCDTAIEGANTYLKEYTEKASHNYKLMKKLQYKGGIPEFMLVKKDPNADQSALSQNLKTENHMPQEIREIYDQKAKEEKKKEATEDAEEADVDINAEDAIKQQKKSKKKRIKAHNEEPKYTISEIHNIDLTECFDGPAMPKLKSDENNSIPRGLVIKIELPGVRTMKNAKLEMQEKRIKFQYLENFILDKPLPYCIVEKTAKAKYDKEKQVLTIELEIDKKKQAESKIIEIKKPEKKEEVLETETIEMPSLFNIYKSVKEEKKKEEPKQEEKKIEIKYKVQEEEEIELPNEEVANKNSPVLVEEIQQPKVEQKEENTEINIKDAPKIEAKYDFKQVAEFVILTYKVKGYKKETVSSVLTNNEMLLEVFDPTLKSIQRTCVTLFQPIIAKESQVDKFTDFICAKLKKADPSKAWDSLGYQISNLTPIVEEKKQVAISEIPKQVTPVVEEKKGDPLEPLSEEKQRQENLEKAEDALEQKQKKVTLQYLHLDSPIIFGIY